MHWPVDLPAFLSIFLLLAAAWTDVATRIIPNTLVACVAGLGIVTRLMISPTALFASVAVSVAVFILLLLLHTRRMLGGGDVKLAAAICLGLSPISAYRFIFITAMAGGILALVHLAARRALRDAPPTAPPPRGTTLIYRIISAERWRISRHGSLPYGVAIACGGILAILAG
jgi:prepilin peptidase CpaA